MNILLISCICRRKNLSKNNSKSLTALRQKLRKYIKDFEEDMAKFRENPDLPDEDEEKGNTVFRCCYLNSFFDVKIVDLSKFSCVQKKRRRAAKVKMRRKSLQVLRSKSLAQKHPSLNLRTPR